MRNGSGFEPLPFFDVWNRLLLSVDDFHSFSAPLSAEEDDVGDQCAQTPGNQQRDEQRMGLAVGEVGAAGEIGKAVCHGNAQDNGGDHGDPHGGDGVAAAAHDSAQNLRHGNAEIAESQNPHHADC